MSIRHRSGHTETYRMFRSISKVRHSISGCQGSRCPGPPAGRPVPIMMMNRRTPSQSDSEPFIGLSSEPESPGRARGRLQRSGCGGRSAASWQAAGGEPGDSGSDSDRDGRCHGTVSRGPALSAGPWRRPVQFQILVPRVRWHGAHLEGRGVRHHIISEPTCSKPNSLKTSKF
jgi:hypothetical protein